MSISARTTPSRPENPAEQGFSRAGLHEVTFATNTRTGDFRALCTCGWGRIGPGRDEQAIRNEAATHDYDWIPALNAERVAP